jgi:threonine dehydrogenase-like Zn-dependent dehydrogenase
MNTIRAGVLKGPYQIEGAIRETREPGPHEVVLSVGYVGICGSDLHAYRGELLAIEYPRVIGHELCAKILQVGLGVKLYQPNQWVSVAPLISCGGCNFCLSGNEHLCPSRVLFGVNVDGGFQEQIVMPANTLFPLPVGVSPRAGTLAEPMAVCLHAVHTSDRNPKGLDVVVSGAGTIGLLIARILRKLEAKTIRLLDIDAERLQFARELGFEALYPAQISPSNADLVFIANDSPQALADVPAMLAPFGTAVIVGIIADASLNWFNLLLKEGVIRTSRYFTLKEFGESVALLGSSGFDIEKLVQAEYNFSELISTKGQTIFEQARRVPRVVIKMDESDNQLWMFSG